jgi:hypothetical protein
MNFDTLTQAIADIHKHSHTTATKAINTALTLRNWLIGAHIHEYELRGEDRADYGEQLIVKLSEALLTLKVPACDRIRLYSFLTFYRIYPQIQETLSPELLDSGTGRIFRSLTGKLTISTQGSPIVRSLTAQLPENTQGQGIQIVRSLTEQFQLSGNLLLTRLSFTHLELLSAIPDPLKRAFYEIESIKGNWSVRELKRQIASLYFERSGLSKDKENKKLPRPEVLQAYLAEQRKHLETTPPERIQPTNSSSAQSA